MTHADAQIEIALLASIEQQARRTAAALERVRRLMREVNEEERKAGGDARHPRRRTRKKLTAGHAKNDYPTNQQKRRTNEKPDRERVN